MDNKAIYKKTLTFSLRRFLWDVLAFIIIILVSSAGFFLADKAATNGLIGLAIGIIIGSTISSAINVVVGYLCDCCLG